ncbi:MAG: efflux RND transporter periplasmic adaptor subunit, partial [Bdellovibrionales bacterium]|nr:efflux RND transporter periplasmic adaptor subunit [Bdellovibrionales bacterium]
MNKVFIKNRIVLLFLTSALALFQLSCTKSSHENHQGADGKGERVKKVAKYVCPMHPQITSEKPGSCSICGMDLVPVEAEEDSGEPKHPDHSQHQTHSEDEGWEAVGGGSGDRDSKPVEPQGHTHFKLSLDKQQLIGVKLAVVKKRSLFKTIRAPGRIAFDPELYTAQSEYLEANRQWARVKDSPIEEVKRSTREMINSAKIRLQVLGLSAGQIQDLGRKGRQSEGLLLTGKGQENWIYADVFEMDLPYIKKDLSVEVTANFLQGKRLFGKVVSVDEVINPNTRTAKVRIKLKEANENIRPESYVNVSILAPLGEHLTVPV